VVLTASIGISHLPFPYRKGRLLKLYDKGKANNAFYHTTFCFMALDSRHYKNHKTCLQHPQLIPTVESAVIRYNRGKLCFLTNQCSLVHRIIAF